MRVASDQFAALPSGSRKSPLWVAACQSSNRAPHVALHLYYVMLYFYVYSKVPTACALRCMTGDAVSRLSFLHFACLILSARGDTPLRSTV